MRILVTGGAGFIGSNLVRACLDSGHQVGIVDDLSTGVSANVPADAWFRRMDILDPELTGAFQQFAPEAVVHLAAQSSVTASIADPERDREVNVEGTRRVARAAAACGVGRVLSASSAAVYGEPAELPLTETSPKSPANPYGASKLAAESVLAEELAASGVDFASMRFSNVYGPRQSAEGEGGVVALFCAAMTSGRDPIVFGDGTQTRDFIYVGDVASFIAAALAADVRLAKEGADGPAYNVSTGDELSVKALLLRLRTASGYIGGVRHEPSRTGDVDRSSLDPSKARAALEWRAEAPIDRGLAETWRWFRSQA